MGKEQVKKALLCDLDERATRKHAQLWVVWVIHDITNCVNKADYVHIANNFRVLSIASGVWLRFYTIKLTIFFTIIGLTVLLYRRILDPVPDPVPEVAIVYVCEELNAPKRIWFGFIILIALNSKQYHA